MSTAPAVFLGIQPGFRHLPAIELFNLTAAVGGLPVGATVSRQTLERYGFRIPPRGPGERLARAVSTPSRSSATR